MATTGEEKGKRRKGISVKKASNKLDTSPIRMIAAQNRIKFKWKILVTSPIPRAARSCTNR